MTTAEVFSLAATLICLLCLALAEVRAMREDVEREQAAVERQRTSLR